MRHEDHLGIYVSVPFCRAKCSFCNFASGVGTAERMGAYVSTLCAEIHAVGANAARVGGALPQRVDTVYFGGGTPSLLEPTQLQEIFTALRSEFSIDENAEITLEAAPGQIAEDLLDAAQRCGVTRVSLGVQSFVDAETKAVGRSHTAASCTAEIARLRASGIQEVAADLIAGLPLQTAASWQQSLQLATETPATHWSVYMFECDEDSRLGREVLSGGARMFAPVLPSGDAAAAMYEAACDWMEHAGFPQYEISNFAAPQHQSRHNRKYWERKPYVGFGVDAHSMLRKDAASGDAVRFANADSLDAYGDDSWASEITQVHATTALEESLFLGLRLNEGVSIGVLQERSSKRNFDDVHSVVAEMTAAGLMTDDGDRWRLTPRGRMISNEVFERLLCVPA